MTVAATVLAWQQFQRVVVFSNVNIGRLIRQFLASRRTTCPVIVAVARLERMFAEQGPCFQNDPKAWQEGVSNPHHWFSGLNLVPHHEFVPHYRDLSRLQNDAAEPILLASAALPLGIFAPITLDGVTYQDGGLADNCPVLPLLENQEPFEQLLIIALAPRKNAPNAASVRSSLQQLLDQRRRKAVYEKFRKVANVRSDDMIPRVERTEAAEYARLKGLIDGPGLDAAEASILERLDQCSIYVIAPEHPLRTWLLPGTIAFFPRTIRRFFDQGVQDTEQILAASSQHEPPKPPRDATHLS